MSREEFVERLVGLLMEVYAEKRAPELLGKDTESDHAFIGRRMRAAVQRVHDLADQVFPKKPESKPAVVNGPAQPVKGKS